MRAAIVIMWLLGCGPEARPPVTVTLAPSRVVPPAAPVARAMGSTHVSFVGNHELSADDLLDVMTSDDPDSGPYDADVVAYDVMRVQALYYDHGYIEARVDVSQTRRRDDGSGFDVEISISEGTRFRVGKISIDERDDNGVVSPLGDRPLRDWLHTRDGDWFNRGELVKDLAEISRLYHDAGFANVEAPPNSELLPKQAIINIDITVRRGPRVVIERVDVLGERSSEHARLLKMINITPGSLYGETKLDQAKARLAATGEFTRVDVSTEAGATPDKIRVTFEVSH